MVTSMFADPLVLYSSPPTGATSAVAISGTGASANSFVCTGRGPLSSTYAFITSAVDRKDLFIGRQIGKRQRFTVRFTRTTLVPSVVDASINEVRQAHVYTVVDIPLIGLAAVSDNDVMYQWLANWLYCPTDGVAKMRDVITGQT